MHLYAMTGGGGMKTTFYDDGGEERIFVGNGDYEREHFQKQDVYVFKGMKNYSRWCCRGKERALTVVKKTI